jgi:hypothetical protein
MGTYIANIDQGPRITARAREVCERVWRVGLSVRIVPWSSTWGSAKSTSTPVRASTSKSSAESAATCTKATTSSAEAATGRKSAAEITTAAPESWGASKSVLTNLKVSTLPIVSVELLDGVSGVFRRLESDDS